MASYTILRRRDGKCTIEVDEGETEPIVSGPYKTEAAARAYIEEHRRMAADSDCSGDERLVQRQTATSASAEPASAASMTRGAIAADDQGKIRRRAWRRLLGGRCSSHPRCARDEG
jgi:hypothetical protein